ncbi:MAG TPA: DUF5996 family protein [Chthonomonadales bacterium]|nr:DUF5996 family protein [Chthonomonadales bacterium]
MKPDSQRPWPELPAYAEWEETCTTLLLWSQIVGKVRLALGPPINHFWGSTLYVTTRGLTTSAMAYGDGAVAIDFDFTAHALRITTSEGKEVSFSLRPMSVADFYAETMRSLNDLGVEVRIFPRPVEVVESIPFAANTRVAAYDRDRAHLYWSVLVRVANVFSEFRARFVGKVSPVHLFWGAFDLAVTRFSGRTAPKHPGGIPNCAAWVMEEAYSHEVSSAGFWSGAGLGEAAFYSYAYPVPKGFNEWRAAPAAAYYNEALGEFILPYRAIRESHPEQSLLQFLQSTYEGAATLAAWDRPALERSGRSFPVHHSP